MMAQKAYETSKTAIEDLLKEDPRILIALLFGSVAKGQTTPLSDIDIAVFWEPNKFSEEELFRNTLRLTGQIVDITKFEAVQVVSLNSSSPEIRFHVFKHGIVLKSVSEVLLFDLHHQAVRDYLDTQYIRDVRAEITRRNIYA